MFWRTCLPLHLPLPRSPQRSWLEAVGGRERDTNALGFLDLFISTDTSIPI